jgi:hypothetical protein
MDEGYGDLRGRIGECGVWSLWYVLWGFSEDFCRVVGIDDYFGVL